MTYNERLNEDRINKIDRSGLFGQYEKWPIYAKEAINISPNIPEKREIKNIIFIGMGGSATSGDIIQNWLRDELPVPFEVLKDYKLPGYVDNKTLVIGASISGETRETISACIEAKTKKDALIALPGNFSSNVNLGNIRVTGSIAYEMALVCLGILDYAVFFNPKLWDVASGHLLAYENNKKIFSIKKNSGLKKFLSPKKLIVEKQLINDWQKNIESNKLKQWSKKIIVGSENDIDLIRNYVENNKLKF